MKHTPRYSLRALAQLLNYPNTEWLGQLMALVDAIDAEDALPQARRAELRALATELLRLDPMEVQVRYVETFDRGRSTSLHLFEHVHGDSRDRGPALVDLQQTYQSAGMFMDESELPDHQSVVLEFASTQTEPIARAFLGEMAHILTRIFSALHQRGSPYASVVAAVLELAGHKVEAVVVAEDEPLDESWADPVAFDGCSTRGQARANEPQPIHFVRPNGASQGAAR